MGNTKLGKNEKIQRKQWMKELIEAGGELYTSGRFTVAKMPEFTGSRMAMFGVAVCSPDEKKNRRKVGEYVAMMKIMDPEAARYTFSVLPAHIDAEAFAEWLEGMQQDYDYSQLEGV